MDELGEGGGEAAVLFLEPVLGAENHTHVGESGSFGVRAGGVAGKFWLIGGGGGLGGESRSRREQSRGGQCETDDDGRNGIISHLNLLREWRQELARQILL